MVNKKAIIITLILIILINTTMVTAEKGYLNYPNTSDSQEKQQEIQTGLTCNNTAIRVKETNVAEHKWESINNSGTDWMNWQDTIRARKIVGEEGMFDTSTKKYGPDAPNKNCWNVVPAHSMDTTTLAKDFIKLFFTDYYDDRTIDPYFWFRGMYWKLHDNFNYIENGGRIFDVVLKTNNVELFEITDYEMEEKEDYGDLDPMMTDYIKFKVLDNYTQSLFNSLYARTEAGNATDLESTYTSQKTIAQNGPQLSLTYLTPTREFYANDNTTTPTLPINVLDPKGTLQLFAKFNTQLNPYKNEGIYGLFSYKYGNDTTVYGLTHTSKIYLKNSEDETDKILIKDFALHSDGFYCDSWYQESTNPPYTSPTDEKNCYIGREDNTTLVAEDQFFNPGIAADSYKRNDYAGTFGDRYNYLGYKDYTEQFRGITGTKTYYLCAQFKILDLVKKEFVDTREVCVKKPDGSNYPIILGSGLTEVETKPMVRQGSQTFEIDYSLDPANAETNKFTMPRSGPFEVVIPNFDPTKNILLYAHDKLPNNRQIRTTIAGTGVAAIDAAHDPIIVPGLQKGTPVRIFPTVDDAIENALSPVAPAKIRLDAATSSNDRIFTHDQSVTLEKDKYLVISPKNCIAGSNCTINIDRLKIGEQTLSLSDIIEDTELEFVLIRDTTIPKILQDTEWTKFRVVAKGNPVESGDIAVSIIQQTPGSNEWTAVENGENIVNGATVNLARAEEFRLRFKNLEQGGKLDGSRNMSNVYVFGSKPAFDRITAGTAPDTFTSVLPDGFVNAIILGNMTGSNEQKGYLGGAILPEGHKYVKNTTADGSTYNVFDVDLFNNRDTRNKPYGYFSLLRDTALPTACPNELGRIIQNKTVYQCDVPITKYDGKIIGRESDAEYNIPMVVIRDKNGNNKVDAGEVLEFTIHIPQPTRSVLAECSDPAQCQAMLDKKLLEGIFGR